MSLIVEVRRTLRHYALASQATRVAVAVSGGPDSTALLHVLCELHAAGDLQVVGVAHLNHQLRPEADADERHCARAAETLGLPYVSERADVLGVARQTHRSIEDAAHHVRRDFYARAAQALAADVVAVGHTMDDQAETFLLRLMRGAGTRGLASMRPSRGVVIRPLLCSTRASVRAFLEARELAVLHDASNDDRSIPRNRVRAELLPLLTSRFNPAIVETLAADADLAREDQVYFEPLVEAWMTAHASRPETGVIRLHRDALLQVPRAVGWRALHAAMAEAADGHAVTRRHVEQAWAAAVEQSGGVDVPRHRVERLGSDVVLTSRPAGTSGRPEPAGQRRVPAFSRDLPVPGEVSLPEIGCVMSAEVAALPQDAPVPNRAVAVVPKDKVASGLVVRNRRAGDRLRPSDVGQKKLQDLFVDRKVPRESRDRVPVVTDQAGRIVWVTGHAIDQDFRVSDPAQAVVILRLKAVGGSS